MVQMTFKNGVKASLKMAYSAEVGRRIVFYCTLGELLFEDRTRSIEVRRFGEPIEVIDTRKLTNGSGVGHASPPRSNCDRIERTLDKDSKDLDLKPVSQVHTTESIFQNFGV